MPAASEDTGCDSNSSNSEACLVDWLSATQELKEKQGIDIKQEMERLLALDEQYKKEVETNKLYKEQIIEYASKINDLEKKVDIMTKSMISSSCIASLATNPGATAAAAAAAAAAASGHMLNGILAESNLSLTTMGDATMDDDMDTLWTEREYRLALWAAKRWRFHQMTSFRVHTLFYLIYF